MTADRRESDSNQDEFLGYRVILREDFEFAWRGSIS